MGVSMRCSELPIGIGLQSKHPVGSQNNISTVRFADWVARRIGAHMGLTIYYASARPVTPEEAESIRVTAQKYCEARSWLSCEPVSFFPDLQDGVLMGGSKPNFRPHPKDKSAAESSGLPDGKPADLLDIL